MVEIELMSPEFLQLLESWEDDGIVFEGL